VVADTFALVSDRHFDAPTNKWAEHGVFRADSWVAVNDTEVVPKLAIWLVQLEVVLELKDPCRTDLVPWKVPDFHDGSAAESDAVGHRVAQRSMGRYSGPLVVSAAGTDHVYRQ
jgi:hypothetical protein